MISIAMSRVDELPCVMSNNNKKKGQQEVKRFTPRRQENAPQIIVKMCDAICE